MKTWKVNGCMWVITCFGKSLFAMEVSGCYGKEMDAMEITSCYGN
jgi:hypothetical protein